MQTGCKLERTPDKTLRPQPLRPQLPMPNTQSPPAKLFLNHLLAWACLSMAAVIIFAAPWWWQKLTALPCASAVDAISILAHKRPRNSPDLIRLSRLIPYIDPIRASNRTGQIVYQFVHPI